MTGWLISAAVAVLAALGAALRAALKAGARAERRAVSAEAYRATRERINHAGEDMDRVSGADVERRLHEHADK